MSSDSVARERRPTAPRAADDVAESRAPERPAGGWHAVPAEQALAALDAAADGLATADATRRRERHGPNRLAQARRRSALQRLLLQFHNFLIYILLAAGIVAALLGHLADAVVIVLVVIVNAVIGYVQEGRAEQAVDAIRNMIDPRATVLRDGQRRSLAAEEIVPGDVVLLEAGDRVPADLRLLRARNLRIEEAVLTGESVAVEKAVAPVAPDAPLGDRDCLAFSGTLVVAGQGSGLVVGTGMDTELGRVSALLGEVQTLETPLIRQMNGFARRLTWVVLGISFAVFAFGWLLRGLELAEAFMALVAIAVAAIPAGLPAVMTITLALGVRRMAARHAIVRRLPAVETLGSVSVICSDKTGTLTRNEMMVQSVATAEADYEVGGVGYEPRGGFRRDGTEVDPAGDAVLAALARAALLCNDAELRQAEGHWRVDGDPMEGALLALGAKAGNALETTRREWPRLDAIPFDTRHRFMATLHHDHEKPHARFVCVKGAPERLLQMCSHAQHAGGARPLDAAAWEARVERLASAGQRVLAIAMRGARPEQDALAFEEVEGGLVLLGLVGLIDPPREEAIEAVDACRTAGVGVKMITGDHAATALAIAKQLHLAERPIAVTGRELDALDAARLRELAARATVFARTTPEHKLRLVEALQADGSVVAMTGDGVNDAPALKRADVGVAMGHKGTEAAKEAAEMVLADDNFASIVAAVREGRTVYDNLKKVIAWTLPTNGGEAFAIIAAILAGLTLPVTPVQILWINMVTAVTLGLTLAFEPTEPGTMRRPPRPASEPLLSGVLAWRIVFVSFLFVCGAFGIFFWAVESRGLPLEEARTLVVNTIVVMEVFYLFSVRIVYGTSLSLRAVVGTRAVLIALGIVVLAQAAFTYLPFMQAVFQTRAIGLADGLVVLGVGLVLLVLVELEKAAGRALAARRAAHRPAAVRDAAVR